MAEQLIITGAKLFLGLDESVIEDGAVWIDGDTIKYAGPAAQMGDADPAIERVDVGGHEDIVHIDPMTPQADELVGGDR